MLRTNRKRTKHAGKELPSLVKGDTVRVSPQQGTKEWKAATVVGYHNCSRSYIIDTGSRRLRRNIPQTFNNHVHLSRLMYTVTAKFQTQ
jgi:hypothetical protein